ncbi:sugar phosphate isomerase/epimerase family protein [Paradesertivirga mongoliensis]|uniref:Sugar phosphate isomerase/epimerase family protein n=1 Tax=Paradesertivirga mongoliensis TaxID=2100740 RepID=A0ABW4ZJI6_9SPHI|nr:sugar phosphate isomerase/epimerase [Pedobacter mongoliensis]
MTKRRAFLKQAGVLSASALLLKPDMLFARPSSLKIGFQLFNLREYIGKDVKEVIGKIAKAGYQEIETFGYDTKQHDFWRLSSKALKAILCDNGLKSPSGHYDMNQYFNDGKDDSIKAYIEAAHGLGQNYIVVPSTNEKFRKTSDDFKSLAGKINKIAEMCKASGLKLAYHNHDFEFVPINGTVLYDVLLKETDPALVQFEMDLYWVVRAGHDPVKLFEAHPGRFALWHVKDMDKAKPERNTEIGSGSINFKRIFQHQKLSGVKHIFMEQESFSMDAYQSITQSSKYIKNTLLK